MDPAARRVTPRRDVIPMSTNLDSPDTTDAPAQPSEVVEGTPSEVTKPEGSAARARGRKSINGWRSGWCGPSSGPCLDAEADGDGVVRRRCRGQSTNGYNVVPRVIFCVCPCHTDGTGIVPEQAAHHG